MSFSTARDFSNQNEVKWCPGCGDHAILKHFQSALAKSGIKPEKTVVVSGIGCASRLPYYMNTYGFHTIHGRALPIATGIKLSKPEMNVWVITGDGDGLSIGGNHFLHLFRRDINLSVLLFNNHIYGLTKGQYSPTSELGQFSKSSPTGNEENSINALHLALTVGSGFVCRTFDRDATYIQKYMVEAQEHRGSSLVEILQNCPIFNDGVFDPIIDKRNQAEKIIRLEHGQPILFGESNEWTIIYEDFELKKVRVDSMDASKIWIHDESSLSKAQMLTQLGHGKFSDMPVAMGILYRNPQKIASKSYLDYNSTLEKLINQGKIKEM
ncbi:MAG: 2-oxoacid:ferredoxin oxidoreductase subunit beta [Chitinophagales bacterium]|nr:2-oxoacid:ferredoxin oxidoreductase subunit beta [Chitinophagales bacterium]